MHSSNRIWYSRPSSVGSFARDDALEPALVLLLMRLRDSISERDVLDIGVGAGRTTRYLSALTPRYVGIDYSPYMVAHSASRFPGARIELGDAQDLSRFATASFDFVLFSYAGIDAADHDARLRILAEVARILRPGGVFAFSAHNRVYTEARRGPKLGRSRNPISLAANIVRWARQSWTHARMRRREQETEEYALINDVAENYSLLHYYIDRDHQQTQLTNAGFAVEDVLDDQGNHVEPEASTAASAWLWYEARRIAD